MRLAILDGHEGVALGLADWGSLGPEIHIDVYQDNIKDACADVSAWLSGRPIRVVTLYP